MTRTGLRLGHSEGANKVRPQRGGLALAAIRRVQRGGPHLRSDADELALRDLFIQAAGLDTPALRRRVRTDALESVRDVVRAVGYSAEVHRRLGRLRRAFFALDPELAEPRKAQFIALASPDPAARRAAARWFESHALGEITCRRVAWMMSPDVTGCLAAALRAEPDDKIQLTLACALSCTLTRYFPDARAFPLMVTLTGSRSRGLRMCGVGAADAAGFDRWDVLVPRLADAAKGVRQSACLSLKIAFMDGRIARAQLRALGALDAIAGQLGDRDPSVREGAAHALMVIDARRYRPLVEAACRRERVGWCKQMMRYNLRDSRADA
jgi:hypothetical protein